MKVKLVNQSPYPAPAYTTPGSAGMDIRANIEAPMMLRSQERIRIPTGLFIQLPPGYEAQVRPRSGLALTFGVTVLNAPGTIDSDYTGEIQVLLINHSPEDYTIQPGERIAQLVVGPYIAVEWEETAQLEETERGVNGFGSSGTL
ncbi:MAG: dUTP diphosphatase [Microscillaceae bacterium]|nr:dUTP diphosphatase [Microscillaceae bacterium]